MNRLSNSFLRVYVCLLVLLLVACSSKPMPQALDSAAGAVEADDYYLFEAADPVTDVCFVFYPGGLVNAAAYAPYIKAMADNGVHGFLLKLRFDLAMFDEMAADDAKQSDFAKNHCRRFVLAGHSLGGLAMTNYAADYPQDGLIYVASYPYKTSLADHRAPVMSISGSEDLLSTQDEIAETKSLLPAAADYIVIQGGNHAQFGWYGPQSRDGEATISRSEQQRLLLQHSLALVAKMNAQNHQTNSRE